jgi:hypothetical protein
MSELLSEIWTSFTTTIGGLANGIKEAFLNIIYVDPDATTRVVSDVAKFGFVMLGLSMAIGLVYGAFKMIRR